MEKSISKSFNTNDYLKQIKQKLSDLLTTDWIEGSDRKYTFFIDKVLPSLTNEYITSQGNNSFHFGCPFNGCHSLCSTTLLLERHLRQQHYDELPKNIFGEKKTFHCTIYDKHFKRKEYLKMHNKAEKHLKVFDLKKADCNFKSKQSHRNISSNSKRRTKISTDNNEIHFSNKDGNPEPFSCLNLKIDDIRNTIELFNSSSSKSSEETRSNANQDDESLEYLLENDLDFVQTIEKISKNK